jgi:LacI family transcriptional regulator
MKRTTLTEVARAVGLTKSAVSLALRHDPRIPASTRRRVEQAAGQLGYRRNAVVAHLMSELRRGTASVSSPTIALLNLNEDRHAFTRHPTIPVYVRGVRQRAKTLGYAVDTIAEPSKTVDGRRLRRILHARSIRGCILTGLMRDNRLPRNLAPLWQAFPCVITGVRTEEPQLPFACADHHAVSQMAVAMALRSGRRRPALVLDRQIDELVQGRFSAGFLVAQKSLPAAARIPPYYHEDNEYSPSTSFVRWFERHRPDAILTLYHVVEDWLRAMRVGVPRDVALVQLEWRPHRPAWAGVDQHNDRTGAAAVDLLIQMIHAGETALQTHPRAILIEPSWQRGPTLLRKRG